MAGLLAGKRLLITGIITDQSIAFSVATARLSAVARSCLARRRSSVA